MTVTVTAALVCDGCQRPFPKQASTIAIVRREAHREGWREAYVEGVHQDCCPECAASLARIRRAAQLKGWTL